MTTVVTGAAGFAGSHPVGRLLSDGSHVVGIDNDAIGNPGNIAEAAETPRFSFLQADIADHQVINPAFQRIDDWRGAPVRGQGAIGDARRRCFRCLTG